MARTHGVQLASNGGYWQATWRDTTGARRRRSLGPKGELSRRQARARCDQLAGDLALNPTRRDTTRAPHLVAFLADFLAARPHLSRGACSAYDLAGRGLVDFVGDVGLEGLTPGVAGRWHAAMTDAKLAPATVACRCRHVRTMLNDAVERGFLARNPFKRLPSQPAKFSRTWHYVERAVFTQILAACPNDAWRAFLALQRLGGLRRGEARLVEWQHLDWAEHHLHLPVEILKTRRTGRGRTVPLEPELYAVLLRALDAAEPGQPRICPPAALGSNPNRVFAALLRRSTIPAWEDLFQTLRRCAVQDLRRQTGDAWLTTTIAGHSEDVEREFYLTPRAEDLARITGVGIDRRLADLVAAWPTLSDAQRATIMDVVKRG